MASPDITLALEKWAAGDSSALDQIAPEVYPRLRDLAGLFFRGERPWHTWQPTALVSELFLKLASQPGRQFENRLHFFNACARLMRMALIDHARGVRAGKRGSGQSSIPLHPDLAWLDPVSEQMLDFDRALDDLARLNSEQAAMFENHYLLGCSIEETAELFATSKSTVDRKVRLARAFLFRKLK